jgi:Kdo2-lipid IVA lauroyltransferase/acyltransferase
MQRLSYLVSYPFLWFISVLPFPLFYRLSDIACFLVYRLVGYRKKVVRSNLQLTFPGKTPDELKKIEKRFYRHMCDMFLESVKTMAINEADLRRRYLLPNLKRLQQMEKSRSVLLLYSHYGNWEWSVVVNRSINATGYAVYQKLNNPYFDKLFRRIRARWNTRPINQKETVRTVVKNERDGVRGIYGIVSDQSPQAHRAQYWAPFMGVTVPIFTGPETLARKLGLAVYYAKVNKLGRGHYSLEFVPICKDGQKTKEHEITDRFLQLVEEQVRAQPAFYLWTHRRWKHRNKVPERYRFPAPTAG